VTYLALYIYAFYLLFVVTMAAKAAWPMLTLLPRILLAPVAIVAVLLDVVFNVFVATFIFMDLPQEYMFTQRLNRYKYGESDWRTVVAVWLCKNLLDPFQSGGHCRA
jgi:hypothetical protein